MPTAPSATATTVAARMARFRGDAVRSRLIALPVLRAFSDKSLIALRQLEREARAVGGHGSAVALRDCLHDRQAEAGAGFALAPEALERALGVARARAFVGDGDLRAVDRDRHAPLPVRARVRDEVSDGAGERRPFALYGARPHDDDLVGACLPRQLGKVDGLGVQWRRRVLAGKREQVVEQYAEACGVG